MSSPDTYFQRGIDHLQIRRIRDALDSFSRAERAGADPDACAAQRWYCWMLLGLFESAWKESDAIAGRNRQVTNCFWDGLPFDGKRVIVRSLHGYGDAIQFIRYLPLVKDRASRVILETHPDLIPLVRGQPFLDEAISWEEKLRPEASGWDQQIEIMEFPRAFRTSAANIPCVIPYLRVPGVLPEKCLEAMERRRRPRVGIVWSASDWDCSRSLPLESLARLVSVRNVSFFSFQHGRHRDDLGRLEPITPIEDTAAYCQTIAETAAALTRMDLLITVDTMAAHLAGALGTNVWTILQWHADWRWMMDRDDTPWYPTMRLFRQPEPGNWKGPLEIIARRLRTTTF